MEINNLQKLQAGNGTQTILLIDAFNLFIRHYMANETINNKSEPIGGVVGFLKSLKYLTDVFKPRKVIVCYEAGGGSPRRKKIYPEYKANRAKMKELHKTMKNNNTVKSIKDTLKYDDDIKLKQLVLLNGLLKTMPVCQVFVKDVEGDDKEALLIAAWFHDTGYVEGYENHEKTSTKIAADFLREKGKSEEFIALVSSLILATAKDYHPKTHLEKIIKDADYAHLMGTEYVTTCELLRLELKNTGIVNFSNAEWTKENLNFLLNKHRFYTDFIPNTS